jgi:hypothetical protein
LENGIKKCVAFVKVPDNLKTINKEQSLEQDDAAPFKAVEIAPDVCDGC